MVGVVEVLLGASQAAAEPENSAEALRDVPGRGAARQFASQLAAPALEMVLRGAAQSVTEHLVDREEPFHQDAVRYRAVQDVGEDPEPVIAPELSEELARPGTQADVVLPGGLLEGRDPVLAETAQGLLGLGHRGG